LFGEKEKTSRSQNLRIKTGPPFTDWPGWQIKKKKVQKIGEDFRKPNLIHTSGLGTFFSQPASQPGQSNYYGQ
jgi:hypothetical protein